MPDQSRALDHEFADLLVTTFNDPGENPVHLLFNQWWAHAPDAVKADYVDQVMADANHRAFVEEGHFADPLDLDMLRGLPADSLGRQYHDWIVDNGLAAAIATDYRDFHALLEESGHLDGMPQEMRYAVLRGFQIHDFLHVLTGYDSSGRGEIALQAFCLAQLQFPYFGMWMSVVTTRMTFADPRMIVPMMDAITDGWQHGRRTPNLQHEKWETLVAQPLADVRARVGIEASPLTREMAAA